MNGQTDKPAQRGWNPWVIPGILVLMAVAVRTWIAAHTCLISTDSAVFLRIADFMRSGEIGAALASDFHPLYPAAIAGLSSLTGLGLETCGVVISIALGGLTVLPLYFIARELFSPLAGVLAALVLVFHPYSANQSADIMSEAMYIFFLMSGAWALLWGMKKGGAVFITACGLCSGLAYLVRPEGLGLLLAAIACVLLCRAAKATRETRTMGIVMAVAACVVVAAPYILHLSRDMEGFDIPLTRKKSVLKMLGLRQEKRPEAPDGFLWADEEAKLLREQLYASGHKTRPKSKQLLELGGEFCKTMGFFGLPLVVGVIALFAARGRQWGNTWLLLIIGVYAAILILLYLNIYKSQTPSKRHLLPLVTVCMVWSGYGLERLAAWIRGVLSPISLLAARAVPVVLLTAAFIGSEIYLMKPRRREQLGMRYMGEVIRSQGTLSPLIMTSEEKVAYYAGGRLTSLPPVENENVTEERFLKFVKLKGVHFIVVSEKQCDLRREHSFKFLNPENYDGTRLELLEERADEDAVRARYGIDVQLDDKKRFIAYRVKR